MHDFDFFFLLFFLSQYKNVLRFKSKGISRMMGKEPRKRLASNLNHSIKRMFNSLLLGLNQVYSRFIHDRRLELTLILLSIINQLIFAFLKNQTIRYMYNTSSHFSYGIKYESKLNRSSISFLKVQLELTR